MDQFLRHVSNSSGSVRRTRREPVYGMRDMGAASQAKTSPGVVIAHDRAE